MAETPRKYSQQKIFDPNFSRISQMSCSWKNQQLEERKHTHTHAHTHTHTHTDMVVSIVAKGVLANQTVNYETRTKVYVLI